MIPRKLSLFIACFSYGGNGGFSSTHPAVYQWLLNNQPKWMNDPRSGQITLEDFCDTPITMTRNKSILRAREHGADMLLWIDSDQRPDLYIGVPDVGAKPFWDTSFDFLYQHYDKGPVLVAAPYCGPPPHENCYCFRWATKQSHNPDHVDMQLEQFSREDAANMGGIQEAAAMPTGLMLIDMRCFELN